MPLVGALIQAAFVAAVTRKVYTSAVGAFATRHRKGGGRGYQYELLWGPAGNPYRGAHTVELPLLFGRQEAWEGAPLVAGASWSEIEACGRELRRLWAGFARTGRLPVGRIDGLIDLREI